MRGARSRREGWRGDRLRAAGVLVFDPTCGPGEAGTSSRPGEDKIIRCRLRVRHIYPRQLRGMDIYGVLHGDHALFYFVNARQELVQLGCVLYLCYAGHLESVPGGEAEAVAKDHLVRGGGCAEGYFVVAVLAACAGEVDFLLSKWARLESGIGHDGSAGEAIVPTGARHGDRESGVLGRDF